MSENPIHKEYLFRFSIEGKSEPYTVVRSPLRDNQGIQFVTIDDAGNCIAWIQGDEVVENEKTVFHSTWIYNPQRGENKENNTPTYVPHSVGRTIVELVSRGYIDVWRSSMIPRKEGRDMYSTYLTTVPALKVTTQDSLSFVVTRR